MIFGFFSPDPSWLGGFSLIDPLSGFPPQFFLIGLRGFSLATRSFETHQLSYGARMFSIVSQFSSPVFLIGLEGFSPDSYLSFLSTILYLAELTSEERGNCNNVIFGAESFQSRNHVTTINHDFISSSLTSIMALDSSSSTPHSRRYIYLWKGIPLNVYQV